MKYVVVNNATAVFGGLERSVGMDVVGDGGILLLGSILACFWMTQKLQKSSFGLDCILPSTGLEY
jgi:hypothetical protein